MQSARPVARGLYKWGEKLNSETKINIERYWKDYVLNANKISVENGKKCYILSMFPYPSGNLHMGHVRVYAISDSIARFKKMIGMNVIHPMGWDAFGLPAENAAIEREVQPCDWTRQNINKMKEQLLCLGCDFDWDREINTSDASYYKWTQYLFLELYNAGLAYKKEAFVNWDPVDQTVLAEEQVDARGHSWRSGAKVEKRLLNQWFIKTTRFAKQLYDGLGDPGLLGWKDIIQLQKHWIGECNGISIDFSLCYDKQPLQYIKVLTGWTDKPESLLCAKFLAVPHTSFLNKKDLISQENDNFKRLWVTATNPITNENLPIFITNQIMFAEGCNAHIGCPELNETDEYFASIASLPNNNKSFNIASESQLKVIRQKVCETAQLKKVGGYLVSSKLKDWLISRQRYWGTPIPIIYCKSCGQKPVTFENLPVTLPHIKFAQSLKKGEEWISTHCPDCGRDAIRETDTMDTFVDSSWYYFRYLDSGNTSAPFCSDLAWKNMPVDLYIGGKEHAVLHLYYARFISHFLHSIGKTPESEPFRRLLVQGMVKGKSYKIKHSQKYISESEVKIIDEKKGLAVTLDDNLPVEINWEKMSKSKYNGVNPSEVFSEYGCDTTRLLMLADVAPTSHRNWSTQTFPGILNWQLKLWQMMNDLIKSRNDVINSEKILSSEEFKKSEIELWEQRNLYVAETTFNYNFTNQLSVAISRMQTLTKYIKKVKNDFIGLSSEYELALAAQFLMLAPIAPHFACELWAGLISAEKRINKTSHLIDWEKNILNQKWPVVDPNYSLDVLIMIGGKNVNIKILRDEFNNLTEEKALELALNDCTVQSIVKKKGVKETMFHLYPNCRAILKISSSEKINIFKGSVESSL
ncbi:leucyl-tRNA synthetase, mitochondrial [Arctopsyche grandis]|uniref:leucyl-tRNA synthetase, mitochondrial n=1 Tax=Arctopsyche grandis TaxID=121162 RepID=UPI00406D8B9B